MSTSMKMRQAMVINPRNDFVPFKPFRRESQPRKEDNMDFELQAPQRKISIEGHRFEHRATTSEYDESIARQCSILGETELEVELTAAKQERVFGVLGAPQLSENCPSRDSPLTKPQRKESMSVLGGRRTSSISTLGWDFTSLSTLDTIEEPHTNQFSCHSPDGKKRVCGELKTASYSVGQPKAASSSSCSLGLRNPGPPRFVSATQA